MPATETIAGLRGVDAAERLRRDGPNTLPMAKAGKVKVLAVSGAKRNRAACCGRRLEFVFFQPV